MEESTKWTLYQVVNGERKRINGNELDTFIYTFSGNVTDVIEDYIIEYIDGDTIHEELSHKVLTGSSCVTKPTKCDCEKIGFVDSNNTIRIGSNKNASGVKKCFTRNNCSIYYKVEYSSEEGDNYNWLNVSLNGNNIGFSAKSECVEERQAVISIYYDEEKRNKCNSFTVIQNAKSKLKVKWEIILLTKSKLNTESESVIVKDIKLKMNNNVLNDGNASVTGSTSNDGYLSGSTTVDNNSVQSLINSLSIYDNEAKASYLRTLHIGIALDIKTFESNYTTYKSKPIVGNIESSSMYCCNQSDKMLCIRAYKFIGRPSDYTGSIAPKADGYDVIMRYEIKLGNCL